MKFSQQTQLILDQITSEDIKMGDLRKIAKNIKKDHVLALELWQSSNFHAKLLAILIMDPKQLTDSHTLDQLFADILLYPNEQQLQLADWLLANQLTKNKNTIAQMETWENSKNTLQRRLFWYYQARLRWVGQSPPPNTIHLLEKIEKNIMQESPEVQWAMNFTAAQIGVFMPKFRQRCINLGLETGLYRDEIVPRGCVPSYLPKFIPIQVAKQK